MLDVLLLWPKTDEDGVQDEVFARLLSLMKGAPGLRRLRVNDGDLMARGGPPPYSRVVEASFESLGDWMAHVDVLNSQPDLSGNDRVTPPLVMFFEAREV